MGNNLISLSDVSCQRLFLKMMICVMDVGWNRKKNFIQPSETPYEKKIVFFKVIEASLQAKGFWSGPPLGLQRWGRVGVCGSLILVCTHFFYVILKKSDLQRLCRNNRPQTSVEMSFITTICFGVQKLLVD